MSSVRLVGPGQPRGYGAALSLTAVATLTGGATVTGYTFRQTAAPFVALAGTGNTRTFTAPAVRTGGVTLTFAVTAAFSDGTTASDTATMQVLPVTEWLATADGEVPMTWQQASTAPLLPAPVASIDPATHRVSWTVPATPAGGRPVFSYTVQRRPVGTGEGYTTIGVVPAGTTSFTDTSAAAGSSWAYRVGASSLTGIGAYSAEVRS